jgi:hypothetical protein
MAHPKQVIVMDATGCNPPKLKLCKSIGYFKLRLHLSCSEVDWNYPFLEQQGEVFFISVTDRGGL